MEGAIPEVMGVRFIDLFAGIGGFRLAASRVGGECVFACEIDEEAQNAYESNWDEEIDASDIRDVDGDEVPEHELLLAGWPCPSFSIIGDKEGLEDNRGSLFFEIVRLIESTEPDAFVLENVKHAKNMNEGAVMDVITDELEGVGYTVDWRVLNALDFGVPQHRERLIIVGFESEPDDFTFPESNEKALETETERRSELDDLLVDDPDDEWLASKEIREARQMEIDGSVPEPSIWHENRSQHVSVNPYACALRSNASWNYQLVNGRRLPTTRELLRLQGFPDWFEIPGDSYTRARKLTGNTVPVPMVKDVLESVMWVYN